ncbi:hypothetical protein [Amycolatopsis sp. NPDC003676]
MSTTTTEFRVRTGVLAAVSYVVFFLASLVFPGLLGQNRGASIVTPYSTNSEVAAYLAATSHGGVPIAAFCQAVSGLALLVFAGWSASYLHCLGRDAHASLARTAGTAAGVFLLLSASIQWILSLPGITDNLAVYRAVTDLSFTTGAAVQIATIGLLTAAVATGARIPKWLAWFGLGVAALSVLSMLSLLTKGFSPFLPIGRYLGMVWFLGLAALLPLRARPRSADRYPANR